jgi:D-alanyl-D-alanine carboxypeptidase
VRADGTRGRVRRRRGFSSASRYRRRRLLLLLPLGLILIPALLAGLYSLSNPSPAVTTSSESVGGTGDAESTEEEAAAPKDAAPKDAGSERGKDPTERRPPEVPAAASCDHLLVLVDRDYGLPPDYAPNNLSSLTAWGVPTLNGEEMLLRRGAARQLSRLVRDAALDGEELIAASAYRSYAEQRGSYDSWTDYYGEGAGGVSAPPGHSQHQLGTAVDLTNSAAGYQLDWGFGDTTASGWLLENAWRYGYVIGYPSLEETEDTGYTWEPWHYRFIGLANARRWKESGLTLQQFLEQEGVLPRCGTG